MTNLEPSQDYKHRIKNDMSKAVAYTMRKQRKHDSEMNLLRKSLPYLKDVHSFLDAPCGTGRATILLSREGYATTGIDLGTAAVTVAQQKVLESGCNATIEQANLEHLSFDDKAFDATLCFRLYHHFPNDEIRRSIISELCRVSKKYVVISYLSPMSYTSIKRDIRKTLFKKHSLQHATSLSSIQLFFAENGYRLVKDLAKKPFIHTLHLAIFERIDLAS